MFPFVQLGRDSTTAIPLGRFQDQFPHFLKTRCQTFCKNSRLKKSWRGECNPLLLKRKFTKGWDGQEVLNRPMSGRKDYTLRMKHAASFFKAHQSQLKSKMASGASLEEGRIDTVSTLVEDVENNASASYRRTEEQEDAPRKEQSEHMY